MLTRYIHLLIVFVYTSVPLIALMYTSWLRASKNIDRPLQRFRLTALGGMTVGVLVCIVYAVALHGRLLMTQVLLTGYFAIALMLILQGFDRLLWVIGRWVFRLARRRGSIGWYNLRSTVGLVLRTAIIFCVGLPYVLATAMTYRPRVATMDDPQSLYQWNFQRVVFSAVDGTRIVGWWIPAADRDAAKTVLLCPGSNGDKATQLSLAKGLVHAGYNILTFDFRGHGESGGQLCSFGDLERQDVLGAMRWLRLNHPDACRRVAGLGVSTGGAALLAAAADPSPEGQNIDAVAVYGTFDRLDHVTDSLINQYIPLPMGWFVKRFALPMAGYQVGANLSAFAPEDAIRQLWPRPVLVIHGLDDEFVPFNDGQNLYDAAMEPKMNFWIKRCDHAGALRNEAAARLVRKCFDEAQRLL